MNRSGRQIALVVDGERRLLGLVTDGDVRKAILRGTTLDAKVDEVMNRTPVVVPAGLSRDETLALMRSRAIRHVPVLDGRRAVVDGDILTKCDFRAMLAFHGSRGGAAMTVGVSLYQVEIPYGEFVLRGERIERVEEKPRKEFPINAGIYVIEPSVVDMMPQGQYVDAPELIRRLIGRGAPVAAYAIREYWLDVGRHPDLEKANRDVAEGLLD